MISNILLILNTILLIYILIKVKEIWQKKKHDDWLEEKKNERESDKAMVEFYGSSKKLFKESPEYIVGRQVKKMKTMGLKEKEISDWVKSFMEASPEERGKMVW